MVLEERDPASVQPMGGTMLVEMEQPKEIKRQSGLIVPEGFKVGGRKTALRGKLVSHGPRFLAGEEPVRREGDKRVPAPLEAGTMLLMHGHARALMRFSWQGLEYRLMQCDDIEAVEYAVKAEA